MLIKINGRLQHFSREITLNKDRPGHWSGTVNGHVFKVEGGKAAGGTRRDWFVESGDFFGGNTLHADSLVECLKLLDST